MHIWVCLCSLSVQHLASTYIRRRQASRGTVILWAMFCWSLESCHLCGIFFDMYYLLSFTEHVNLSWKQYSLMAVVSFSTIMHFATKEKWFRLRNGLRITTMSLRCCQWGFTWQPIGLKDLLLTSWYIPHTTAWVRGLVESMSWWVRSVLKGEPIQY